MTLPSVAFAQPHTPTAEEKAGARAAAEQGSSEFEAQRYAKALDLFQRAESLIHAPTHVLMIARTQVALGQLVAAVETYRKIVREELKPRAPSAFKKAQEDATKELRDLEPRVPQVNASVSDPSAKGLRVTMDGRDVPAALVGILRPVDPGEHVFVATADGLASKEVKVTVAEGESRDVKLVLAKVEAEPVAASGGGDGGSSGVAVGSSDTADAPAAKGGALRVAAWSALGVGVVGLGVGAVFTGLYASKRGEANDAFDACGSGCSGASADHVRELDDSANTKGTVGAIALAAGGALAVGGVVLLLVTRPKKTDSGSARMTPWIGAGSVGVAGAF
jgi:hypothetical protein